MNEIYVHIKQFKTWKESDNKYVLTASIIKKKRNLEEIGLELAGFSSLNVSRRLQPEKQPSKMVKDLQLSGTHKTD